MGKEYLKLLYIQRPEYELVAACSGYDVLNGFLLRGSLLQNYKLS